MALTEARKTPVDHKILDGRVGPVTVSILLRNLVTAAKLQRAHYESAFRGGFSPCATAVAPVAE